MSSWARSDVDADRTRSELGEPGREVRSTAPELHDVEPGDVAKRVQLALGSAEHAPLDLVLEPGA